MTIKLEDYLREYPILSVAIGYASALLSLLGNVTPLFAAISAVFGAIVIFYTLRIKLVEYEIKKRELDQLKKKDLHG
jgi:hypothetical protein